MPRTLFVALCLLACSSPALAGAATLQNDGFTGGAAGAINAAITKGEGWAATFKVEPEVLPVRLKKLQGLFALDPNWNGAECGAFSIKVFEDTGLLSPAPDGPAVFDSMLAGETTFDIPGNDSALQEVDFGSFSPLWIETPGFRVEVHAEENVCLMVGSGNMHFPVLAVDADGVSGPGLNTLYTYDLPNQQFVWLDMGQVGVSGDYILRAVVETTGCTPNCAGRECGSDGCQGTCGACPSGEVCVTGQCCTPDCSGKACGGDGCGGSCGSCGDGRVCTAGGICEAVGTEDLEPEPRPEVVEPEPRPEVVEPEPRPEVVEPEPGQEVTGPDAAADTLATPDAALALRVDEVVPAEGPNDRETDVLVLGAGFVAGATVRLDADHLIVKAVTAASIEATVPIGLAPGLKTIVVQLPGGELATRAAAFTVTDASTLESSGGGSGCSAPSGPTPGLPALGLLALALGLLWRHARRSGV